ncbi:PLAC8 family protein [Abeliophyllum distichum]|uniref:PLAC8 family protein n=1 Tax=Abeliophyllum distichum TaxID=126358 RepID=A0ABD1NSD3_9LAMI
MLLVLLVITAFRTLLFTCLGIRFFGWNCLAPWFSYPIRSAIRRKFNLEGSCEALARSCGCCGSFMENEVQREQCESACDFATHVFCHACALCQEGREVRRRLPHPGFIAQPVLVMIPPGETGHGSWGVMKRRLGVQGLHICVA